MLAPSAAIRVDCRLRDIASVADLLESFGARHGVSVDARNGMNVVLDEILSNIVHYGHPGSDADHYIDVTMTLDGPQLVVCIDDDGVPFDPAAFEPAAVASQIAERVPGGLGLRFVRALVNRIEYTRRANRNRLLVACDAGIVAAQSQLAPPGIAKSAAMDAVLIRGAVEETAERGVRVVAISGRVDNALAANLLDRLTARPDAGVPRIVVDLGRADFVGSAALRALLGGLQVAQQQGGRFALCSAAAMVLRSLEISGLDKVFSHFATRAQAVRDLAEGTG